MEPLTIKMWSFYDQSKTCLEKFVKGTVRAQLDVCARTYLSL